MAILIPLNTPSPEVCKTIFSAMANGYPSPIILNWGNVPDKFNGQSQSHLERLTHLQNLYKGVKYLDTMMYETVHEADRIHEDDLVIIIDGLDIWWQLPPDVFIKRYHEANRLANERLRQQYDPVSMFIRQTIVAGAQKRCGPVPMGFELHCDALPDSPERPDLFGDMTDAPGDTPGTVLDEFLHFWRPKFYNASTIAGATTAASCTK